jgi:hypothetical protein
MTPPQDEDYLDLFKPKDEAGTFSSPGKEPVSNSPPEDDVDISQGPQAEFAEPPQSFGDSTSPGEPEPEAEGFSTPPQDFVTRLGGQDRLLPTLAVLVGGGCLLIILASVVIFAFVQVFLRRDSGEPTPPPPTATAFVTATETPAAVTESPIVVPLVSSDEVQVPVALPQNLIVGDKVFAIQAINTEPNSWPPAPVTGDIANWVYGTVINYVLGLAPTPQNQELLAASQIGDVLSLEMSTGLVLHFNVDEVVSGVPEDGSFFRQTSPRLTLAVLTDDPTQQLIVTAAFFNDEPGQAALSGEATNGTIGTPVSQGPVRVTLLETYQASAAEAGLPPGTGYLLVDFAVENVGTQVLETEIFQTFVMDTLGERYPLSMPAGQLANYGLPSEPLAPGETVIGSAGYLMPDQSEGQLRWAFNPLPGSEHWVVVSVPYQSAPPTPTPEPPEQVGFAQVTLNADDVFVDRDNNQLVIQLQVTNVSQGVVVISEEDISLSSFPNGEARLVTAGPLLPWTIEPGDQRLFELHFEMPSDDPVLLSVMGYTFEIGNLDGG